MDEPSEGAGLQPADLRRMRDHFLDAHPSASEHAQALIVAIGIYAELLGQDWLERNLDARRRPAADYFPRLTDPLDEDSHFLWEYRLVDLANLLYHCQRLPNFFDSLEDIRQHDLRGVSAELRAAYLLSKSGHHVRFVHRRCEKGRDFDLEVSLHEVVVAVEVKSKKQDTTLSEATILSTVRGARRQLPKEGPGIVVLVLPDSWVSGIQLDERIAVAVERAVRQSGRINSVILLWEAVLRADPPRRAVATCFYVVGNQRPKRPFAHMDKLLGAIAPEEPVVTSQPSFLQELPSD